MITVFVDLDGVVCDFKSRYVSLYGEEHFKDPTQVESRVDTTKNKKQFNEFVSGGNFATLDALPNASNLIELLDSLVQMGVTVEILSSLGRADDLEKVYNDKSTWLTNHNIYFPRNFVVSKKFKKDFANCKSILIDDHVGNIEQFKSSGGIGILYEDSNWEEVKKTILYEVNKLFFSGEVYPELPKKKLVFSREERKTKYI